MTLGKPKEFPRCAFVEFRCVRRELPRDKKKSMANDNTAVYLGAVTTPSNCVVPIEC